MRAPVEIKSAAPKRTRRTIQVKLAVIATPSSEKLELSEEERQLIVNFRRMGRASRTLLPKFANRLVQLDAENARKATPPLRLVVGGVR